MDVGSLLCLRGHVTQNDIYYQCRERILHKWVRIQQSNRQTALQLYNSGRHSTYFQSHLHYLDKLSVSGSHVQSTEYAVFPLGHAGSRFVFSTRREHPNSETFSILLQPEHKWHFSNIPHITILQNRQLLNKMLALL